MMWLGLFALLFLIVLLIAVCKGEGDKYGKWRSNRSNDSHTGSGFML